MKKILLGIVMIGVLMVASACADKNEVAPNPNTQDIPKEFVLESKESAGGVDSIDVIRHIDTGNRFVIYRDTNSVSIAPLDY